jgi:hypothetical protein
VNAGRSAIKARIKRDGHFPTKAGIVRPTARVCSTAMELPRRLQLPDASIRRAKKLSAKDDQLDARLSQRVDLAAPGVRDFREAVAEENGSALVRLDDIQADAIGLDNPLDRFAHRPRPTKAYPSTTQTKYGTPHLTISMTVFSESPTFGDRGDHWQAAAIGAFAPARITNGTPRSSNSLLQSRRRRRSGRPACATGLDGPSPAPRSPAEAQAHRICAMGARAAVLLAGQELIT